MEHKRFNIGYAPRGPTGVCGPGGGDGADGMTGLAGNSSLWKYVYPSTAAFPNPGPGEFTWFPGSPNPGVNPWNTTGLVFNPVDSIVPNGREYDRLVVIYEAQRQYTLEDSKRFQNFVIIQ